LYCQERAMNHAVPTPELTAKASSPGVRASREYVVEHGCYSPEENLALFKANYEHARHQFFLRMAREFDLANKVVCDAGCGYGANLSYCHPDSYGLDVSEHAAKFCRSLGLNVHLQDIVEDDLSHLPKVDVVWNSATIEHVDSPHVFLRKLHGLLKPGGVMLLEVPLTGSYRYGVLKFLPNPRKQSGDHINAFTPTTLRFFCERAGFDTQTVTQWSSKIQKHAPQLPLWAHKAIPLAPIADRILYVGRKPDAWEYPTKARRRVADTPKGFKPRD
jgi:SAM-dependent methyltransferase